MKADFNQIVASSVPTLVDFFATWCGPCKMMNPILQELAGMLGAKARIIKIDVDKNPAVASQFNIRGVPTLMLFKNSKAVWSASGVIPADQLKEVIDQHS